MNGVTGSVLQILRHLERRGHEAHVVAPAAVGAPSEISGAPVEPIPSLALPGYRHVRVGTSSAHRIATSLARFQPDVVHLASPFALGWRGVLAAERLELPAVAAYQTDVAAYTERYRVAATTGIAQAHIARLHRRATITLAPSADSARQLTALGIDRVRRWGEASTPSGSSRRDATARSESAGAPTSSSATSDVSRRRSRSKTSSHSAVSPAHAW